MPNFKTPWEEQGVRTEELYDKVKSDEAETKEYLSKSEEKLNTYLKEKKYGTSKPYRERIRGSITSDPDKL